MKLGDRGVEVSGIYWVEVEFVLLLMSVEGVCFLR